MTTYRIAVTSRSGDPLIVPASLDVRPRSWSAVAGGGHWDATIEIAGGLDELAGLTAWLGCSLDILDAGGAACWWGDVATVEIAADGVRRGLSLENVANRVQVRYVQKQAGGGAASADTTWAEDTLSIASYGTFERRIAAEREMTAAEAANYRDVALARLAWPHHTLAIDNGPTLATLYCTGYWQRTRRTYYSQAAGLVAHNVSAEAAPLGLGFTSSAVAFVARTDQIHSIAGYLTNFQADMRVRVSGAAQAGNNGAWLLESGGDERTAGSYTSTAVTFSPADDIADANGGLGFLAANDAFTISGTNDNNGTWLVDSPGAAAIEVSGSYHGAAVDEESAGDTVVFSRGNLVKVVGGLTNEHTGSSVTITAWGQKHYQPFVLPSADSWTAAKVEIRLRRVGGPTDGVIVQLCADSAGAPGTVLDSATVAADDIPLEMGWVAFALSNSDMLASGTTYGLTVARTGANHHADYYEIDLDAGATYAGGALRQWDGAAWQTPDPAADMVFRVLGATDTGSQIAAALSTGWDSADVALSSLFANQNRSGEMLLMDELDALLALGTAASLRMVARVGRNTAVSVYAKPDKSLARWTYSGGRLLDLFGQPAPDGFLPAGEWVNLGSAASLGPWAALSPVFIERAEYRADGGLTLEPEGSADPFAWGVRQG